VYYPLRYAKKLTQQKLTHQIRALSAKKTDSAKKPTQQKLTRFAVRLTEVTQQMQYL